MSTPSFPLVEPNRPTPISPPAQASPPKFSAAAFVSRGAWRWLAGILLTGYAVFLATNMVVVAGGSDSSGYLNSARLLAEGKLQTDLRVPPEFGAVSEINRFHFSPQGFGVFESNPRLPPSYPTGLPLHFALAAQLAGMHAGPFLVQLFAAVGAVWLCYRTARELGADFALAGAGAVMLATFPVFIFTSIQTLSDTLATTWTLAALLCALKGRSCHGWAAACGAALAIAVLVRPTNLLLAPALVWLLGFNVRRLACFALGGLPGAAWLAFYNHQLYGGALRSGYGTIFSAFSVEYGGITAIHFVKWLALLLPGVLLVLPGVAAVPRNRGRRELAGLGLAVAGIVGVYLFYDVSHDVWWCLRFILPAVAALILAGVVGAGALARLAESRGWLKFRPLAALVLSLWAVGNSWYWTRHLHVLLVPGYERAYAEAAQVVRERLPENALVVCSAFSGTIYYYTDLPTMVYDSIKPEEFAQYVTRARSAGRPIYAVLFNIEEEDALQKRCVGAWRRLATVGNIGIWELT